VLLRQHQGRWIFRANAEQGVGQWIVKLRGHPTDGTDMGDLCQVPGRCRSLAGASGARHRITAVGVALSRGQTSPRCHGTDAGALLSRPVGVDVSRLVDPATQWAGLISYGRIGELSLVGRVDEARSLFEHVLGYANDVGLFSEEIDPDSRELLGNFPQGFSHPALIHAAVHVDTASVA